MTEEDLRNLGINPAAMNAAYYPQGQSVTSADLATLGAGNPKDGDAAYLNGPMPVPAQPTPQDLEASQYPSDPNGLVQQESMTPDQAGQQIAPQPSAQVDPNGNQVMTGSVPDQEQPQQSPKDQKLFWDWYKTTFQVRKGDMVDSKHVNAMQLAFANATLKAKETPPPQVINANGHHYLQVGSTVLDAEPKPDRFHQVQLADGTLGQVDRESNTFTPFKDSAGQIVKGKTSGIDVDALQRQGQMMQLQQQAADLASKVATDPKGGPWIGASYADQLRAVQAKMAALQNPQQIAPPTTKPAPTAIPAATPQQAQAPAMDPATIRSAYKSGKLDKATAVSLLRQHGFQ